MGGAEATGAGSSQQKKRRVEEGDPLSAAKKSKRVLSKKGETTFDWSTVSVPVLRAFLCLIPDDKEHVMEAKAVLELTDADVLAKAIEYDKEWGLDGWTTNSWATDLKEAVEFDDENKPVLGLGDTEMAEIDGIIKKLIDERKKADAAAAAKIAALSPGSKAKRLRRPPSKQAGGAAAAAMGPPPDLVPSVPPAASVPKGAADESSTLQMSVKQLEEHVAAAVERDRRSRGGKGAADEEKGKKPDKEDEMLRKVADLIAGAEDSTKKQKPAKKKKKKADVSSSSSASESDTSDDEEEPGGTPAESGSVFSRLSGAGQAGAKGHPDHPAKPGPPAGKLKPLSKAVVAATSRMDPLYQLQKLLVEKDGGSLLESVGLSDLFSAISRQFRLEANIDTKSAEAMDEHLRYLDFARDEAVAAFKSQVQPITDRADLVRSAEHMLVMYIRNKVRASGLVRKLNFTKIVSKGLDKVVEPIVTKEVEKQLKIASGTNPPPPLPRRGSISAGWRPIPKPELDERRAEGGAVRARSDTSVRERHADEEGRVGASAMLHLWGDRACII
jgi:hypothetical protein